MSAWENDPGIVAQLIDTGVQQALDSAGLIVPLDHNPPPDLDESGLDKTALDTIKAAVANSN